MWLHRLTRLYPITRRLSSKVTRRNIQVLPSFQKRDPAISRWYTTAPETLTCSWVLHNEHLELLYSGTSMSFDYVWLRDHCRSASCYNAKTNQRILDTASIDLNIKPMQVQMDETTLYLTWPDGHMTQYGLDWLMENSYECQKQQAVQPRILWNKQIYEEADVPCVSFSHFLEEKKGLMEFLKNFLLYGIAFVSDVPATREDTERVARRVSYIRETIYGKMWDIRCDFLRGDAYSNIALDRHIDTTYFQEPCGVQIFHCLQHDGTGGRTLLVDGFYAADQVCQHHPEDFEILCNVPLRHQCIEDMERFQNHLVGIGPVLNVYPWNKELYMIRYNNEDRSVFNTVPYDIVRRWYSAHRTLTKELRRPENELWVNLNPGKVLFIDNWRVLHGRESFTGYRLLSGCYLPRDDVLNTSRLLGLKA